MLKNIDAAVNLRGMARAKARTYTTRTIHPKLLDEALADGWVVERSNRHSVRIRKAKTTSTLLEDRVWTLFYRMGFEYLSGSGGAQLEIDPKDLHTPLTQIDLVGIDDETAIAVECKSAEIRARRPQFQDELGKHSLIRQRFAQAIKDQFNANHKRQVALAMFMSNIILSDNDRKRAQESNVILFDEQDLAYYEALVSHLGPAARYQFLADMLPGKAVPGLEITLPAIRARMGGILAIPLRFLQITC